MKGSRWTALLTGLTAALTLAACGVPPSGVIQAGEPASGMFSPSPQYLAPTIVSLYFLRDGDMTVYPRKLDRPADVRAVVGLLFGGPTGTEAATATTELPRLPETPEVTVGGDNTLSVRLPEGVAPLSHPAMLQLACTAAEVPGSIGALPADTGGTGGTAADSFSARRLGAPKNVRVYGDGWTMSQSAGACPGSSRS
ncbi:hypothetical protein [Streptomyces sp. NPDC026673]|uniref:hypothetical protein n=1 Tax=Streptomyces sp. NPDC026673 TaxID=3155724 RepID=UPI00340CBF0D